MRDEGEERRETQRSVCVCFLQEELPDWHHALALHPILKSPSIRAGGGLEEREADMEGANDNQYQAMLQP